jgi:hypothetical protein
MDPEVSPSAQDAVPVDAAVPDAAPVDAAAIEAGARLHERVFARVGWAARVIHRFSTWGAAVGLLAGGLAFLAVLPLLARYESWWWVPVALVLALALVVAPLRVMWHGRRIRTAYGDATHIMGLIDEVPNALWELAGIIELDEVPERGIVRRVVKSWRTLLAVRQVLVHSAAREHFDSLVEPLHPRAIALTTLAVWTTLGIVVLAGPVILVAVVVLLLT